PSGRLGPLAVRRVAPWTAPAPRPPTGSEGRRGPGGLARALRRGGRASGGVGPPGRRALTPPEDCPKMAALPPETPKPRSQEGTDPMAQDPKERSKAIDLALAQIEKQYGKGSIMKLGAKDFQQEVPVISTTSLSIDAALGIGGLPRGRVIEIFGPESSGKTTLALHVVAEAQRQGGLAAFVDAEHALDPEYARKLGVDVDNLLVSQPDSGEQALEITEVLVRSSAIDVLVIDSVAALVPRGQTSLPVPVVPAAELPEGLARFVAAEVAVNAAVAALVAVAEHDRLMAQPDAGEQARQMTQALRRLSGIVAPVLPSGSALG